MSTATLDKPVQVWKMPEVGIGAIVWWHGTGKRSREHGPIAAMVTKVNHRSVALSIVDSSNAMFKIRDGVRHVDDPDTNDSERYEDGCWDFTDEHRRLGKLEQSIHLLTQMQDQQEAFILEQKQKAKAAAKAEPKP